MSAIKSLQTLSDQALAGAIRDLKFNRQWASRLDQLLQEQARRKEIKRTAK